MMDGQGTDDFRFSKSPVENLDIIPARISLAKLESKLVGDFDAPFRLKDRIQPLKKLYKVIVMIRPNTRPITVNGVGSCYHVLIPISVVIFCVGGTDDCWNDSRKLKRGQIGC